jgi:hypothetical protein
MHASRLARAIDRLWRLAAIAGLAGLVIATPATAASMLFVRADGTTSADGTSWGTATTLQTALAIANAGDQIWVKEGTYQPTDTLDRTATFELKQGVALYGGFAGTETSLTQRSPLLHPSILSGNIGAPNDPTDNSYHVVSATGVDTSTLIDGFTIADGYAFGAGSNDFGGGMFLQHATPVLRQIIFRQNTASIGGGLAAAQASPTVAQCSFIANHAESGGGIAALTSDLTISHALVISNTVTNNGRTMNHSPQISKTTHLESDVLQIDFSVDVAGEAVPCVMWKPSAPLESRTLIAMGHGGSQHKQTPGIRDRAIRYATSFGWASLAIDAPGHGDRITREAAEAERLNTERRLRGDLNAPSLTAGEKIAFLDTLAAQAVPEWRAALDTTLACFAPAVDSIGYWGVSQGTWIGVPLLAEDQRFRCAVLGLAHLHPDHDAFRRAAKRVAVPLRFVFQWDDPIRSREYGIALFTAFGSADKSMHINPGGHTDIPATEVESWDAFFQRHLI